MEHLLASRSLAGWPSTGATSAYQRSEQPSLPRRLLQYDYLTHDFPGLDYLSCACNRAELDLWNGHPIVDTDLQPQNDWMNGFG